MKPRRFTRGEPIRDIATLVTLIEKNQWVFWSKAPKHPGFIVSMTLNTLLSGMRGGLLFHAIDNQKEPQP